MSQLPLRCWQIMIEEPQLELVVFLGPVSEPVRCLHMIQTSFLDMVDSITLVLASQ